MTTTQLLETAGYRFVPSHDNGRGQAVPGEWLDEYGEHACWEGEESGLLVTACSHAWQHQREGPTGRRLGWSLLVHRCWKCGLLRPAEEVTPRQQAWIDRYNARTLRGKP